MKFVPTQAVAAAAAFFLFPFFQSPAFPFFEQSSQNSSKPDFSRELAKISLLLYTLKDYELWIHSYIRMDS